MTISGRHPRAPWTYKSGQRRRSVQHTTTERGGRVCKISFAILSAKKERCKSAFPQLFPAIKIAKIPATAGTPQAILEANQARRRASQKTAPQTPAPAASPAIPVPTDKHPKRSILRALNFVAQRVTKRLESKST